MGKNAELGLPSGDGMEKTLVVFDVDGTLIDDPLPYTNTIILLTAFIAQKWKNVDIAVWSGGGADYAQTLARKLFPAVTIEKKVKFYSKLQHKELRAKYDKIIAFDDIQDTRLGDVNLIVRNK
jgi:phosphoglycolate phosphatase-like HAD superfamily hydrolase